MLNFLFWNINKKPIENHLIDLIYEHEIDILILAESEISIKKLLELLNNKGESNFHYTYSLCKRIEILTRFSGQFINPLYESGRHTIRKISLPGRKEFILAAVHFPSKLFWDEDSQSFECVELSKSIRIVEKDLGHSRSILVGDFNMNPFEKGLISSNGFNATSNRIIAQRKLRKVQGHDYPYFYNPSWAFFGDLKNKISGTYYYETSTHINYYWNIFDQVMVRPELIELFDTKNFKILSESKNTSFLKRAAGIPNVEVASDHLPIKFSLKL
jgi:hypothetical protein